MQFKGTTTTVPTTQTGPKYNVRLVGWRERSAWKVSAVTWNTGELRKGSLMPLSKKKRTRRTEVFIFHALIVKMINIFTVCNFLWYLMQISL